jgi:hypothetical protein
MIPRLESETVIAAFGMGLSLGSKTNPEMEPVVT